MGKISRAKEIRKSGQIQREKENDESRRTIEAFGKTESLLGCKEVREKVGFRCGSGAASSVLRYPKTRPLSPPAPAIRTQITEL